MNLTGEQLVILIPITSLAIVQIITAIKTKSYHNENKAGIAEVKSTVNGKNDQLLMDLNAARFEIGKLQGQVEGMRNQRYGARSTDPVNQPTNIAKQPEGAGEKPGLVNS